MLKAKNTLISLAVVAMLAACGGGGGGGDDGKRNPTNPPAGQPGGNTGGNNGGNNGGTNQLASTEDAKLANTFSLSGSGIVIQNDNGSVAELPVSAFRQTENCDPAFGCGLYGQAAGQNAPLESFGYRLAITNPTPGVTAESSVGRVAFELKDQAEGAGQEVLRILVDKVNWNVTTAGAVTVSIPNDAQVYVYAKNAAGGTASVSTMAADNLVRIVPVAGDQSGDVRVVLDVDRAVQAAIAASSGQDMAVLESVKDFRSTQASPFSLSMSLSNLNINESTTSSTPVTVADLSVDSSKVAGVKNGGGVTGLFQQNAE